jgi:hypothetical protein
MTTFDPFSSENLQIPPEVLEKLQQQRPATGARWVWDPVQKKMVPPAERCAGNGKLEYVKVPAEELANLAVQTQCAPLALLIWLHVRWFSRGRQNPFPLSNGEIKGLRLARNRKYRAIKILVEAGLTSIQPRLGKSHLVTLLWKPQKS